MKPKDDDLSIALEDLRNRPIVTESRAFARRWERSNTRAEAFRKTLSGPVGAIAVACAVACVAFGLLPANLRPFTKPTISTGIGETRSVSLDDGSRVMLDTSSEVRVAFTAAAREVELINGQAHFEVAKDAHRPFRVHTRSAEVVAVGTKFDVAALPARTDVTLIEGHVNVYTISPEPRMASQVEALEPGQQLGIAGDGRFLGKRTVKIESVTAWQRGAVVLDDVPLPEALAAINRYSTTQIIIPGPQLQSRRVSGMFRTGDVDTEVTALRAYFGLKESSRSSRAIVLDRN
jgi:transmembrane sensor